MAYLAHEFRVKKVLVIVKSGAQTKEILTELSKRISEGKYFCPIGTLGPRG